MDLYGLYQDEQHPVYQKVAAANNVRHYDFLQSMVTAAIESGQLRVTELLIKAINFHAIVGLYVEAGQYRTSEVIVGPYVPPTQDQIESLMKAAVDEINQVWNSTNAPTVAAYALWRITHIHPFVNGNGRTARAVCYFILCVKAGIWLPGNTILPEQLRREPIRTEYVAALREADSGQGQSLVMLIHRLLTEQLQGIAP